MDACSDNEKKALGTFRNPHTCAQAVCAAVVENPPAEMMIEMRANSGGRAPDGICGALYAALALADESKHAAMKEYFFVLAGEIECLKIKKESKTSCGNCVAYAVRALEKMGR